VLTKLDTSNAKALFRRAHAYKAQEKWELAARDLQELYKENKTDDIKNDMSLCLKKAIESKKVTATPAAKPAAQKPKVEEVKPKPGEARSVKIEEDSDDSDDEAEAIKKLKEKKSKTKQIDKETLSAAQDRAVEFGKKQALNQIPKTAAGFEKDFNSFKKDQAALQKYLQQIPCPTLESWFKRTEVNYELLTGILQVCEPVATEEWVGKLLVSLSRADNFEMTLMFIEESEKALVGKIVDKLPAAMKASVKSKYGL